MKNAKRANNVSIAEHSIAYFATFVAKATPTQRHKPLRLCEKTSLIPGLAECYVERGIFRPPGDVDTRMGAKAPCNKIPETYTS